MFKQKIENGYQSEGPDEWLKDGNPCEVRRAEYATEVPGSDTQLRAHETSEDTV